VQEQGVAAKQTGKILVTATHHLIQDNFLQQSQSNVVFLNNMIEYATWGNELIGVRSRGKTVRPLADTTEMQRSLIKWGMMIGMPIFAIVSGVVVFYLLRKRRLKLIAALNV
jgi:ABC-type uncharacterized transport system involved in gliding motility auxiliary subunit